MPRLSVILAAAAVLLPFTADAEVPSLVGFQGYLTDVSGNAIEDVVDVEVSLFHDATGGSAFWTDEYLGVDVTSGVFSLLLGSGNNGLPAEQMTGGVKYLGISVNGSPEMSPRLQLVSVPYALRANTADSALVANSATTFGGLSAADYVTKSELGSLTPDVGALQQQIGQLQGQVDALQELLQNPGCVEECSTGSMGCSDDLGQVWTCGDGGDEDACNEKLFATCPGTQKCGNGVCSCLPAFGEACFGDDAFEIDSCGKQGKIIAQCGEGLCNDGACVNWNRETPLQLAGMHDVITVAGDLYAAGNDGAVIHYDGQQWTHMATGTTKDLHAIWGFQKAGATELFAVGENGKLLHFQGGSWSTVITGSYNTLRGIFGLSSTNIIAVGDNGTVLKYNGTDWNAVVWDDGATWTTTTFHAVWAHSSSKIWVGGDGGTVIQWDGTDWLDQPTPGSNTVRGMWGVSDQNVWAVTNGQIWRFKTDWQNEFDAGTDLHDVWADVASDPGNVTVYATGNNNKVFKRDALSWAEQLDVPAGFPATADFRGIMGGNGTGDIAPAGGIWIISSDGRFAYNDPSGKWVFPAITREVRACYGVSGDPTNQFAVGADCMALRQENGEWLGAAIDDGTCQDGNGTSDFKAMWGDGTGAVIFAVGESGLFKQWDGAAWLDLPSETAFTNNSNSHNDIWGMDAENLFVVQDGGTAVWNGVTWQGTGGGGGISGAGTSMTDFWVVHGTGAVRHFDGSEWTEQTLTDHGFNDIWGAGPSELWAVGTNGVVFEYNGADWTDMSIPEEVLGNSNLNAVWTTNPVPVYVAADSGYTYILSGGVWTAERTFPTLDHNIVYGADGANVLLGGTGTIYRRN